MGYLNMGEDEITKCLIDPKYLQRDFALNILEEIVSGKLYRYISLYFNPMNIFKSLTVVLMESHAESVKIRCLDLIIKLLPTLKEDLDECVSLALPTIFKHFTNSRNSVKERAIEVWNCIAKLSQNSQFIINYLVEQGLNSNDHFLGEFVADNISLFVDVRNKTEVNYQSLIDCLLKHFGLGNGHAKESIIKCFSKIENIIGHSKYASLISKSPFYTNVLYSNFPKDEEINRADYLLKLGPLSSVFINLYNGQKRSICEKATNELKSFMLDDICFQNLKPNLGLVLKLIANLLGDHRQKRHKTFLELLDVVKIIVERLSFNNKYYIEITISILIQQMGNDKKEVRLLTHAIFKSINNFVPYEFFLANLFPFMKFHPWTIRKSCLDLAILLFLDERFKSSIGVDPLFGRKAQLIQLVINCLLSKEPQLKLSAFECLAAMAEHFKFPSTQSTPNSHDSFFAALENHLDATGMLEKDETDGLLLAMKTRILRNLLPTGKDGLLTYALDTSIHEGSDVDWIIGRSYSKSDVSESDMDSENYLSFYTNQERIRTISDHQNIPINLIRSSPTPRKGFSYLPPVENLNHYCDGERYPLSQIPRPVKIGGSPQSWSRPPSVQRNKSFHNSFNKSLLSKNYIEGLVNKMTKKYSYSDEREHCLGLNVDGYSHASEELRASSLKPRLRNISNNSLISKRQVSCGAAMAGDVSSKSDVHCNDASTSSSTACCSQCSAYDMTQLQKFSEHVAVNFDKSNNTTADTPKPKSNNRNINNYRPLKKDVMQSVENNISAIVSPKFPWKSKRKIQPKKFVLEDFHPVSEVELSQKPITNPNASYNEALLGLSLDKWIEKYQALEVIKTLCLHHPNAIKSDLTSLTRCILKEVRNLRSKVSLLAISTLGEIFCRFQKLMDKEVEESVKTLLTKCGESNKFIREEAEKSLMSIVDNVSVNKSLSAIIPFGTNHKNVMIQQTSSRLLKKILNNVGSNKILQTKDLAEKFLPSSIGFLLAASQAVRDQGYIIIRNMMMSGKDFNRYLHKYVPESAIANAQDKLDSIRSTISYELSKASLMGKSSIGIENDFISSLSQSNTLKIIQSAPEIEGLGDQLSKPLTTNANLISQLMVGIEADLNSTSSKDRHNGLDCLEKILQERPVYEHGIAQVLQSFFRCLTDNNEDVVLKSLKVFNRLVIMLYDHIDNVDYLVDKVTAHLNSSNEEIVQAALNCLDSIMEHFEPFSLLPVFIRNGMKCKKAFKADFITRIHYLYTESLVQRPIQSTSVIYQFLWHIIRILNQQQTSATSSTYRSTSKIDPIPPFESMDSSNGSLKGGPYNEVYSASQALIYTIYTNCQDNLILRCKKSRNKKVILEMLSAVVPDL